jgi:hypothetical protein
MRSRLRSPPMKPLHEVQEDLLPGFQWCLRLTGKLRFARATLPWIPAFAGMTRQVQQVAAGVWGDPKGLMDQAPTQLRRVSAILEGWGEVHPWPMPPIGAYRGAQPRATSYQLMAHGHRVGGRGLTARIETGAAGFARALPALHVDSRFRGNDRIGSRGSIGLMVESKC